MNKQSGFTLIEIVMVLVLLGILSAVAVPKYFDLQEQAKIQAAKAVVAEYQARVNAVFAQEILKGTPCYGETGAIKLASATISTVNADASGFFLKLAGDVPGSNSASHTIAVNVYAGANDTAPQLKEGSNNPYKVTFPKCAN